MITKEELVEKVKELSESESANKIRELVNLKKQWRRTSSEEESLYDAEMRQKFEAFVDKIEKAENVISASAEEKKNEIIAGAKELLDTKNFKQASAKMNELFDSFKNAGHANKELDDELWDQFKTIKDEFYAKKNEYYDKLKETFAQSKDKKEEIIAKAKEALNLDDVNAAGKKFNELLEEWKKAGRAGKDFDDDLWANFSSIRKEFNKKRNEYYESMKEVYAKRVEDKNELIAQAKKCLANSTFAADEINAIKELRNKWKTIGFAGKDNEDNLWQQFNGIVNKYFDNKKDYNK